MHSWRIKVNQQDWKRDGAVSAFLFVCFFASNHSTGNKDAEHSFLLFFFLAVEVHLSNAAVCPLTAGRDTMLITPTVVLPASTL